MSDTALESGDLKLINNKLSIIEEEQANQGQFEEQQHILNNEQTDNLTQPNSQNSDQQYQNMKHQNFKNKKPQNFKQKLHQNLNQQYLNQLDSNEDQNDSSLKNLQIKKSKTYHEKVNQSRNAQEQNNIDKNQNSQQKLNEKQQFQEIQTLPLLPIKTPIDSLQYTCDIYQDVSSLNNIKFDATFKLILIGNSGVGKSCIIKRIGHNKFSEEHEVTIGAEFTTIACQLNRKSFMKMQFWDSCGQERFNSITRIFYRGSSCVLLVYEVNSMQSLRDLEQIWIDDIQSSLKDAILILVGNKADIDDNAKHKYKRQVTQEEGLQFMEKHNLNYFTEVSAKTGNGVQQLVEYIGKVLYHKNQDCLSQYKESETASQISYQSRRSSGASPMNTVGNSQAIYTTGNSTQGNMQSRSLYIRKNSGGGGNSNRRNSNSRNRNFTMVPPQNSKSSMKFGQGSERRLNKHSISSFSEGKVGGTNKSNCCN